MFLMCQQQVAQQGMYAQAMAGQMGQMMMYPQMVCALLSIINMDLKRIMKINKTKFNCPSPPVVQMSSHNIFPRMPLPLPTEMMEEEPVYVNAKQYHRIMMRRQARQKMEQANRLPRQRKVADVFLCSNHWLAFL
jgi:hypothetical protein